MNQILIVIFYMLTTSVFAADLSFRTALLQQNANHADLVEALNSTTIRSQKAALNALTKISTNEALQNLIDARAKILPTNTRQFCNALGQKYLINEVATGFAISAKLRDQAVSLLAELSVGTQAQSHCFEGFAKLSPRSQDEKVEELFKTFQIEKPEVRKTMSPQNLSQILLALYFHRMNTFDPKVPTDRYWFSAEFKSYLRAIPLDRNPEMLVRQSWARVAYLSNDDLVLSDYSKLLLDSDVVTKVISLDLINFVDKTTIKPSLTALKNENYRVVYAALQNLVRLGKTDVLFPEYKSLLAHPQKQIRRAMLSVVGEKLTLENVVPFLQDSSNGVQQVAVQLYLKLQPTEHLKFANDVFAGDDFGLKKGVLDASDEFSQADRSDVFLKALTDQNVFIKNYALELISSNKLTALYPEALKFLASEDPDQRREAVKVVLDDNTLNQRMMMILNVYKNSQSSTYEYVRGEIINYFLATTDVAEQAMLLPLLSNESNWRFANRLGAAIVKLGLGTYTPLAPVFEINEAEKYIVDISNPIVKIVTTQGSLVFELFNDVAPLHVSSFLYNVEKGLLNKNFFHRVEDNFVVQASRPFVDSRNEPGSLPAEILGLRQSRGTLAMPRNEYLHSGQGENFYINLSGNFGLNTNYTVFGKLIAGEAVLDQLEIGDSVLEVSRLK